MSRFIFLCFLFSFSGLSNIGFASEPTIKEFSFPDLSELPPKELYTLMDLSAQVFQKSKASNQIMSQQKMFFEFLGKYTPVFEKTTTTNSDEVLFNYLVEKTTMKLSMNDSPSQPKDLGSTSKDPEQTWLKDYPAKATWSKSMKSFLKIERHPGLTKNMENLKLNAMEQQNVLDLFDVEKIKQSSSNITFLWFLGKTLKAGQQHSVKSKSTDYQYTFQGVFKNAPEQEARFLIAGTKDIEGKKLKR